MVDSGGGGCFVGECFAVKTWFNCCNKCNTCSSFGSTGERDPCGSFEHAFLSTCQHFAYCCETLNVLTFPPLFIPSSPTHPTVLRGTLENKAEFGEKHRCLFHSVSQSVSHSLWLHLCFSCVFSSFFVHCWLVVTAFVHTFSHATSVNYSVQCTVVVHWLVVAEAAAKVIDSCGGWLKLTCCQQPVSGETW